MDLLGIPPIHTHTHTHTHTRYIYNDHIYTSMGKDAQHH